MTLDYIEANSIILTITVVNVNANASIEEDWVIIHYAPIQVSKTISCKIMNLKV